MKYEEAVKILSTNTSEFKTSLRKDFGQISIRMNEETYLSTGGIKMFKDISKGSLLICDIRTGDVGEIFSRLPEANVIIFALSPNSVAASKELDFLESAIDDLAMISGEGIKVIPDTAPGNAIPPLKECGVCLIKGRGILVAAPNMKKAIAGVLIAEKACDAYFYGKKIGNVIPFDKETAQRIHRRFLNSYVEVNQASHVEYIGFEEKDFENRSALVDCGKRLVRDELVCGSWGNFSVRQGENSMLISPSSMDYADIRIEDIVKVDINTMEYGDQRTPSGESTLHARMYRELEGCNAIIHTHSNACSVFAACEAGFAISDSSLHKLIGDVKVLPYKQAGTESLELQAIDAMRDTHAVILSHHGAIFYGPNLEVVYVIAKAVEQMAKKLLDFDAKQNTESEDSE